jgi:hypothetical protein
MSVELRSTDDLLAAVPYLLGFHPRNSLVLVWVRDSLVVVTQRIDLAESQSQSLIGQELAETAKPSNVREVIVVAFTSTFDDAQAASLREVVQGLRSSGATVLEAVHCHEGEWSSVLQGSEGTPRVPVRADTGRIAADFALHGRWVYADRSLLVAEFAADPTLVRLVADEMSTAPLQGPEGGAEFLADCWTLWQTPLQSDVDPGEVARYLHLIHDIGLRDTLIWMLARCRDDELAHAAAWMRRALQGATEQFVAPAATMSALASWLCGDGARALSGLARASEADSSYTLALLLSRALGSGMPPGDWRESVTRLTLQDCISSQMR